MNKLYNILILAIQVGIAFILLIIIYMIFALLDFEGGFDGLIGIAIFQPLIAIILSFISILGCLFVGLPIRLIKRLKNWWAVHFYISILLAAFGIMLVGMSLIPQFVEIKTITIDEQLISKEIPNGKLLITGWFLTAFSILHTFPPYILEQKVKDFITRLNGKIKTMPQQEL